MYGSHHRCLLWCLLLFTYIGLIFAYKKGQWLITLLIPVDWLISDVQYDSVNALDRWGFSTVAFVAFLILLGASFFCQGGPIWPKVVSFLFRKEVFVPIQC